MTAMTISTAYRAMEEALFFICLFISAASFLVVLIGVHHLELTDDGDHDDDQQDGGDGTGAGHIAVAECGFINLVHQHIGAVLDKYVLPKISKPGMNEEYDFEEFFDHIVISRYAGEAEEVIVPAVINNKPVTVIGEGAFQFNEDVKKIVLPETIKTVRRDAFMKCKALETIEAEFEKISFGKGVVGYCSSLSKEVKAEIKKRQ